MIVNKKTWTQTHSNFEMTGEDDYAYGKSNEPSGNLKNSPLK